MKKLLEDWKHFLKEERAPLRFPHFKKVTTRPDQEISVLDPNDEQENPESYKRQKKILVKKLKNFIKNNKQKASMLGIDYDAPESDEQIEEFAEKYLFDKKNRGAVFSGLDPKVYFGFVKGQEKGRGEFKATQNHESFHLLFKQVRERYGNQVYVDLLLYLIKTMRGTDPELMYYLMEFLKEAGYEDSNPESFKEELINWTHSLLSGERYREWFIKHMKKMYRDNWKQEKNFIQRLFTKPDEVNERELFNRLKKVWRNITKFSRNIKPEQLKR